MFLITRAPAAEGRHSNEASLTGLPAPAPRRAFWHEQRRVDSQAHVHRLVNFARMYPRFRDLPYLTTYLARWDQAILALLPHDRSPPGPPRPCTHCPPCHHPTAP